MSKSQVETIETELETAYENYISTVDRIVARARRDFILPIFRRAGLHCVCGMGSCSVFKADTRAQVDLSNYRSGDYARAYALISILIPGTNNAVGDWMSDIDETDN